mgnify:CR=1 FL=1
MEHETMKPWVNRSAQRPPYAQPCMACHETFVGTLSLVCPACREGEEHPYAGLGLEPMADVIADDSHPVPLERCPACMGVARYLGRLGDLDWYRCQHCAGDFPVEH